MEYETQSPNDVAPHAAIIQLTWEVHEKKPNGSYYGAAKDNGLKVFVLNGPDRALANEYVNALIDLIKKAATNVSELEINAERLGQSRVQGASGPWKDSPHMFRMRGRIGRNSAS